MRLSSSVTSKKMFLWFVHLVIFRLILSYSAANAVYTLNTTRVGYQEASDMCKEKGLILSMPSTSWEHQKLTYFLWKYNIDTIWIGLRLVPNTSSSSSDFQWEDGITLDWDNWYRPMSYRYCCYGDDEPNNLETDKCVVVKKKLEGSYVGTPWLTRTCDDKYGYVCHGKTASSTEQTPRISHEQHTGEDNQKQGVNFILQRELTVIGECQKTVHVRSVIQCAVVCSQHSHCDIIKKTDNGVCELYLATSSVLVPINATIMMDDGGKTYLIK